MCSRGIFTAYINNTIQLQNVRIFLIENAHFRNKSGVLHRNIHRRAPEHCSDSDK